MNEQATWKSMSSNPSKNYNEGIVEHMSYEGTGFGWRILEGLSEGGDRRAGRAKEE